MPGKAITSVELAGYMEHMDLTARMSVPTEQWQSNNAHSRLNRDRIADLRGVGDEIVERESTRTDFSDQRDFRRETQGSHSSWTCHSE